MPDWDKFREAVLFAIKHHGTRTEGEDYRMEQVASRITELAKLMIEINHALTDSDLDMLSVRFYVT